VNRFLGNLVWRITHVMEWRDADKCLLASSLTLGFVGLWAVRMWLVERNPALGAYMNPGFVDAMMGLVLFQAVGHLSIITTAVLLRRKTEKLPWLVHVTNQFWYLSFFLDVYAVGPFTSPFIVLFLLAAVFGLIVFPLKPVVLSLGTFGALLVTSTLAERFGFIPCAPLIGPDPLLSGRPHTTWILSLGVLPLLASALVLGLFAYVMIQLRDREQRLKEMVRTDYLTGVQNRRSFMERAELEFARAKRFGNPFSIVMLDVDHFKRVNDNHGHSTGDEVLKVVAHVLDGEIRRHDVIARYGGEEFALLLAETDEAQAGTMAERCRRRIEGARLVVGGAAIRVTASVGIASYPREGVSKIDQLIDLADKALYQAKESGRNQTVIAA